MRDNVCYAGFGVRFFAWLVDMLVMFVPLALLRSLRFALGIYDPYGFLSRAVFFHYSVLDILLYLLPTAYFIAMTWSYGATLGKMLLKLEVVSAERGRLTFGQTLIREIFGRYLSVTLLFIGYLMIIPDREKRALHDRLSDTRVIYTFSRQRQGAAPVRPAKPAPVERPEAVKEPAPVEPTEAAEEPAPVELSKPVEPASVELSKPVEPAPVEPTEAAEEPAPVETAKPVEPAPVELSKPVEPAPVEPTEAAEEPAPVEPTEAAGKPAPVEPTEAAEEPAPVELSKPVETPSDAGENP